MLIHKVSDDPAGRGDDQGLTAPVSSLPLGLCCQKELCVQGQQQPAAGQRQSRNERETVRPEFQGESRQQVQNRIGQSKALLDGWKAVQTCSELQHGHSTDEPAMEAAVTAQDENDRSASRRDKDSYRSF